MKKQRILFIVNQNLDKQVHPLSIRYKHYLSYFQAKYNVDVLNLDISFHFSCLFLNRIVNYFFVKKGWSEFVCKIFTFIYLFKKKYDFAFVSVVGNRNISLPRFICNRNKGIKIIVDLCDPISKNMIFDKLSCKKQEQLLKREQLMVDSLDLLIVLNKEIEEFYRKTYELENIVIIEQGINSDIIKSLQYKERTSILKLVYAGMLYDNFREAFDLYDVIENNSDKYHLSVYGSFKANLYPPNKTCFYSSKAQSIDKLISIYSDADVLVFIDNKDTVQVPGKTLEILATNKPILFIYYNEDSPTLSYVQNFDGVYFTKNETDKILETLNKIYLHKVNYFERNLDVFYWENLIPNRLSGVLL